MFPNEIWDMITQNLRDPKTIFNFSLSHLHAKKKLSPICIWAPIFKETSWIDIYKLRPVLIYRNENYGYLILVSQGEEQVEIEGEEQVDMEGVIRNSLHPHTTCESPCEVRIQDFTLNISYVMWKTMILSRDISWAKKVVYFSIYGRRGVYKTEGEDLGDMVLVEIPDKSEKSGKKYIFFWNNVNLSRDVWPVYSLTG